MSKSKSFKFVGAPGEKLHAEDINHVSFGHDFSGGKAVEVSDPAVIEKLSNNSHFEEAKAAKKNDGDKTPSQMNKTELSAHAVTLGHTLDDSKTKKEMLAELSDKIKAAKE